jgi:hypothetical protein
MAANREVVASARFTIIAAISALERDVLHEASTASPLILFIQLGKLR